MQSRRSSLDSSTAAPSPALPQLKLRLQRVHDDLSRGTNKFYAQTRKPEQLEQEKQALGAILAKMESLEVAMHSFATSQRFNDKEQDAIRGKVETAKKELLGCARDVGALVFIAKDVVATVADFARQKTVLDTAKLGVSHMEARRTADAPSTGAEQPSQRSAAISQLFKAGGGATSENSPSGLAFKLKPVATTAGKANTPEQPGAVWRGSHSEAGTPKFGGTSEPRVPLKSLNTNADEQPPKLHMLKPVSSSFRAPSEQGSASRRASLSEAGTPKEGTPKSGMQEPLPALRSFRAAEQASSTPFTQGLRPVSVALKPTPLPQSAVAASSKAQDAAASSLMSAKSAPSEAAVTTPGVAQGDKGAKQATGDGSPTKPQWASLKPPPSRATPEPAAAACKAVADEAAVKEVQAKSADPAAANVAAAPEHGPASSGVSSPAKPVTSFAIADDSLASSPDSQAPEPEAAAFKAAAPKPEEARMPVSRKPSFGATLATAGSKPAGAKPASADEEQPKWPRLQPLKPAGGAALKPAPPKPAAQEPVAPWLRAQTLKRVGSASTSGLEAPASKPNAPADAAASAEPGPAAALSTASSKPGAEAQPASEATPSAEPVAVEPVAAGTAAVSAVMAPDAKPITEPDPAPVAQPSTQAVKEVPAVKEDTTVKAAADSAPAVKPAFAAAAARFGAGLKPSSLASRPAAQPAPVPVAVPPWAKPSKDNTVSSMLKSSGSVKAEPFAEVASMAAESEHSASDTPILTAAGRPAEEQTKLVTAELPKSAQPAGNASARPDAEALLHGSAMEGPLLSAPTHQNLSTEEGTAAAGAVGTDAAVQEAPKDTSKAVSPVPDASAAPVAPAVVALGVTSGQAKPLGSRIPASPAPASAIIRQFSKGSGTCPADKETAVALPAEPPASAAAVQADKEASADAPKSDEGQHSVAPVAVPCPEALSSSIVDETKADSAAELAPVGGATEQTLKDVVPVEVAGVEAAQAKEEAHRPEAEFAEDLFVAEVPASAPPGASAADEAADVADAPASQPVEAAASAAEPQSPLAQTEQKQEALAAEVPVMADSPQPASTKRSTATSFEPRVVVAHALSLEQPELAVDVSFACDARGLVGMSLSTDDLRLGSPTAMSETAEASAHAEIPVYMAAEVEAAEAPSEAESLPTAENNAVSDVASAPAGDTAADPDVPAVPEPRPAESDEFKGGDAVGYLSLAQRIGKVPLTGSVQPPSVITAGLLPPDNEREWLLTDDYQPPPMARQSLQQWHQRPVLPAVAALTVTASTSKPHPLAASVRQAPWQQPEPQAQPTTAGRRHTAEVLAVVPQSPEPDWRGPAQLFQEPAKSPAVEREVHGAYPLPAQYREPHRNSGSPIQDVPVAWNPLFQSVAQQQHVPLELPASVAAALPAMQDLGLAGGCTGLARSGNCSNIRVEIDDEYESYNRTEAAPPRRGFFKRAAAAVGTVVSVAAVTAAAALAGAALNAGLDELDGNQAPASAPRKTGRGGGRRQRANPDILLGRG